MRNLPFVLATLIIMTVSNAAIANIRLPRILNSGMVLQQGKPIVLWGWADKKERIKINFAGKGYRVLAEADGKWKVQLPAMGYGGPYTLSFEGKNKIVLENILVGEVWICSGQSNMEMSVKNSDRPVEEIANADYPQIRLFTVARRTSGLPQEDLEQGEWQLCRPQSVALFSAAAYFFGRELYRQLKVPIGLIHSSWGGTAVETWTSPFTMRNDPDYAAAAAKLLTTNLQQVEADKREALAKQFGHLPVNDPGLVNGKALYAAIDLNDAGWETVNLPHEFYAIADGTGWYRKEIVLTAEEILADATLQLSTIDDRDITYVNGQRVGAFNSTADRRQYTISKTVLKEGRNVIAVRVTDGGGQGGMRGIAEDIFLLSAKRKIPLTGGWKFKMTTLAANTSSTKPSDFPSLLYNGMIHPLTPLSIQGFIWYQGEGNSYRPVQYRRTFPQLVTDWREQWKQGNIPFLFVSLANFRAPRDTTGGALFAETREAQTLALHLPNTGMAVAIDIGNADDVHPKNKQAVGFRLALQALKLAYHKSIVSSGPLYASMRIDNHRALITFKETGSGLWVKDRYGYIKGFSMADSDQQFHWAQAQLLNDSTVVVYCDKVRSPVAIRYGWADNPDDINLYNKEGLPAHPFRTDKWPGISQGK